MQPSPPDTRFQRACDAVLGRVDRLLAPVGHAESRLLGWWRGAMLRLGVVPLVLGLALLLTGLLAPSPSGLILRLWDGSEAAGEPLFIRADRVLDHDDYRLRLNAPGARAITARWTGLLRAPESGERVFRARHDGALSLRLDGNLVLESGANSPGVVVAEAAVAMEAGLRDFELIYEDPGGNSTVVLEWGAAPDAVAALTAADFAEPDRSAAGLLLTRFAPAARLLGGVLVLLWLVLTVASLDWAAVERRLARRSVEWSALGVLLAAGLGLRIVALYRSGFMVLADEAIVGLMAKHIATGRELPLFFYAQFYGGPLESYLMAPLVPVFGISPALTKLLPLFLGVILMIPVWLLGRELTNRIGGLLCAAYVAFPPLMPLLYSLMAMIGPVEIPLLGATYAALMAGRLARAEDSRWLEFAMGLCAGIGFWINAQILYFLLPCEAVLLLWKRPLLLRFWWPNPGTLGLFLGAFPYLYYNYFGGWVPLMMFLQGPPGESAAPAYAFTQSLLGKTLPVLLGARPRWDAARDVYVPVLAAFLRGMVYLGAAASVLWILPPRHRTPARLFLAAACVLTPLIFCFSTYGVRGYPRYLYAVFPLFPLLLAAVLRPLAYRLRLPVVLLAAVAVMVHAAGFLRAESALYFQHENDVHDARLLPASNRELVDLLEERGIDAIHTDFWIGWNVTLESDERIVHDDWGKRYPPYTQRFRQSTRTAYVFHNNEQRGEWQIDGLDDLFRTLGHAIVDVPPYRAYLPPGDVRPRSGWTAYASRNPGASHLAVDGDLSAAFYVWRSDGDQQAGDSLLIDTGVSAPANRLVLHFGGNPLDAPAAAQVYLSPDFETWGAPIPLQPCGVLNGAWADLGGQIVRALKVELTEDAPGRAWGVCEVFVE